MATVNGQTLTKRQQGLAACACLMAQGDLERLEPAVCLALDGGVTINELKEAFSQLYAYTGFPRSLNALSVLDKVLEERKPEWQDGKPWKRPAEWNDAKLLTNWARRTKRSSLAVRSTTTSVPKITTI